MAIIIIVAIPAAHRANLPLFCRKVETFTKLSLLKLLTVKVLALFVVIIFDIFVIAAIIFRMATERKHRVLLNVF
ncbi:hypothetical protein [Parapedobacter lycopersici]|uniref:hypothetical protein n=1 Tax=Parapedobacter lycopersici TaxID=1864939 RepID=UPI00334098B0